MALRTALLPALRRGRGLVTATSPKKIKRFYDEVTIQQTGETWRVFLDGKVVKSPKGTHLDLPARGVAHRVAQEWRSQTENLNPQEMPLTTVGCTALDIVRPDPSACIDRMLPYLETDTLCFQDEQELLAERQLQEWGPIRKWFEEHCSVQLGISSSLAAPGHPDVTIPQVAEKLLQRDPWELCALEIATQTAKSLIVAVALLDRADISPEVAMNLCLLEENFQIERWGLVEGDHDVARTDTLKWLQACQLFAKSRRDVMEAE
eukprot:TRINITY_DN28855_c0_g1_i1.p1 TRINITY_DN28855_c0_g1~~TRINITY_DN28855_c0_g1_i1.p1  ORF type:complete len:263 (-),score=42.83 TRINITY_DN28855_c0_g1_i1:45-833(-)